MWRSFFDKLWGVWKCGQTLYWVIDTSSQPNLKLRTKRRNKIEKIYYYYTVAVKISFAWAWGIIFSLRIDFLIHQTQTFNQTKRALHRRTFATCNPFPLNNMSRSIFIRHIPFILQYLWSWLWFTNEIHVTWLESKLISRSRWWIQLPWFPASTSHGVVVFIFRHG